MKKVLIFTLIIFAFVLVSCGKEPSATPNVNEPPTVEVPNLIGKSEEEALSILKEAQLGVIRTYKISDKNVNTVIEQDVVADTSVKIGTNITIVVSLNTTEPLITVHSYLLRNYEAVKPEYDALGLNIEVEYEYNSNVPKGSIIKTNLPRTAVITKDMPFKICVSKGPSPKIIIPDFAGKAHSTAQVYFSKNDIYSMTIEEYSDTIPAGNVIKTYPEAGKEIYSPYTVAIYMSLGKKP